MKVIAVAVSSMGLSAAILRLARCTNKPDEECSVNFEEDEDDVAADLD